MKACTRCGAFLPPGRFYREKRASDGLTSQCKACKDASVKRRREFKGDKTGRDRSRRYEQAHRVERNKPRGNPQERGRQYRAQNLETVRARRRRHQAQRRADPVQRVVDTIRRRMRHIIRGKTKGAFASLGYADEQLRVHIQRQFVPCMTWENYGSEWHVDHRRPVSSFSFPEQLSECFALENLRPLWAKDNLAKHAKWEAAYSLGNSDT